MVDGFTFTITLVYFVRVAAHRLIPLSRASKPVKLLSRSCVASLYDLHLLADLGWLINSC